VNGHAQPPELVPGPLFSHPLGYGVDNITYLDDAVRPRFTWRDLSGLFIGQNPGPLKPKVGVEGEPRK